MFSLMWGPTVAAVSVVLDHADDLSTVQQALDGLLQAAKLGTYHHVDEVSLFYPVCLSQKANTCCSSHGPKITLLQALFTFLLPLPMCRHRYKLCWNVQMRSQVSMFIMQLASCLCSVYLRVHLYHTDDVKTAACPLTVGTAGPAGFALVCCSTVRACC